MIRKYFRFYVVILFFSCTFFSVHDCFCETLTQGWGIFDKIESAQPSVVSVTSQMKSDLTGLLYNPSFLGKYKKQELLLITEIGAVDDKLNSVIYNKPLKNGNIAAGVVYYDAGTVELNWIDNTGAFNTRNVSAQKDTLAFLAYGTRLSKKLYYGLSLKAAKDELAETQSSYAYVADTGFLYLPFKNTTISLAAANMGDSSAYIDKKNDLPVSGSVKLQAILTH
jgi:hypothetical protein